VALARSLGGSQRGDWAAILAGDYAVALAQAELASAPCRADAVLATLRQFADIQKDTVAGQFIDVTGAAGQGPEYQLEELKTCSYTVRGPLVIGATLGGATLELLAACHDYARPLGIAFQLRDDLLGLFGDMAVTGKPRGSDLRAGKMTFVIREALRTAEGADGEMLRSVLGKATASDTTLERALDVLRSTGAVARTEARIAALRLLRRRHRWCEPKRDQPTPARVSAAACAD
jgi:geranylgeranyl diphosphate synthase type I